MWHLWESSQGRTADLKAPASRTVSESVPRAPAAGVGGHHSHPDAYVLACLFKIRKPGLRYETQRVMGDGDQCHMSTRNQMYHECGRES